MAFFIRVRSLSFTLEKGTLEFLWGAATVTYIGGLPLFIQQQKCPDTNSTLFWFGLGLIHSDVLGRFPLGYVAPVVADLDLLSLGKRLAVVC